MANRHDRRRASKLFSVEEMTIDQFNAMPSMCAWAGCGASAVKPNKMGWSNMVLYTGEPKLDFMKINPQLMARDCVLCPEHARYLDEHLLVDIGGGLRTVMGNA